MPSSSLLSTRTKSFPDRRTLTRGDRAVVRAMAEAMFSEDGEVSSARLDAYLSELDDLVSAASKTVRLGLRLALFVVRIAPLLLFFRARTIEKLKVRERVVVLARLERSRIVNLSLAFVGWRAVMTLVFYEDAAELRRAGYAGEARERYKKRALPVVAPMLVPLMTPTPAPAESGVRMHSDSRASDPSSSSQLPAVAEAPQAEVA